MKILWFSNKSILDSRISSSGTWLYSMSRNISNRYDINICNITDTPGLKKVEQRAEGNLKEWRLPKYSLRKGLPPKGAIVTISRIVEQEKPDLIHVWGVENYWGLLVTRGMVSACPALLEIQGVLYACSDFYKGGTTLLTFLNNQPFLNALYSYCYISLQHLKFHKRLKYESEIIKGFKEISIQSDWTKHKVSLLSLRDVAFYRSLRPVRKQFHNIAKWERSKSDKYRIVTIASLETYKALHITIMAFAYLKSLYPKLQLSVIGVSNYLGKIPRGYALFIRDIIRHYHLESDVLLKGAQPADRIIEEMLSSRCFVISSFVESYSAVMAEAMNLGIPTVVSYAGAMVEFGTDKDSVMFFTPGDYVECACKIGELIENDELVISLSERSRLTAAQRNDEIVVADNQISIYNTILNKR